MSGHPLLRILRIWWVGALAATLLLAACSGGDAGPQARQFDLEIEQGAVELESGAISVTQGDSVTLNFSADEAGLIHLHGYDIEQRVGPGAPTSFEFVADATGRYNFTFHEGDGEHEEETHDEHEGGTDLDAHSGLFESSTLESGDTFEFVVPDGLHEVSIPFHNHMSHDVVGQIMVEEGSGSGDTLNVEVTSDGGFSPTHISALPGTKVVWTNAGPERARIASGNPPTMPEDDHEEHDEEEEEETVLGALEVRPR